MRLLSILFLFTTCFAWGQFSPIWTIPSNYSGFGINSFNCNNEGNMMLITRPYDGGPISDLMVYTSSDFGQTWDSTFFANTSMLNYNASVTENGNFYFATIVSVYSTTNPPGYFQKNVIRSIDGGITWQNSTLDTLNGGLKENALSFINDSTGMYFYNSGRYLTRDYGNTWQKVNNDGAENLGVLDDRFIFYWYQSAITVNPFTSQVDSFSYLPYCEGNVNVSFYNNGISYRMIFAQDGEDWGSEYDHNYASLNIDELPLGDQRYIHFPQRALLFQIDATESCIHLVLSGRYARSCDGGDTFYDVDAFNGNMNEEVLFLEFINDTLGYLVSRNFITNEYRLWETTNGGGTNLTPILTNQFYASIDELESDVSFDIYPNPASDEINIESEQEIVKVEVYSMDGKPVLVEEIGSTSGQLMLSHLSVGTYVLRVLTANTVGVSRIVKE